MTQQKYRKMLEAKEIHQTNVLDKFIHNKQ